MIDSGRFRSLLAQRGLSQSELARRVKVTQGTIAKLASGSNYGSKYLHKIARELGTTPAYLEGEIDDPDAGAPPPLPPAPTRVLFEIVMPPEDALTRMFEALLSGIREGTPPAEQARLLAQRLPIGLAHLQDLRPGTSRPGRRGAPASGGEAPATPDLEPTR